MNPLKGQKRTPFLNVIRKAFRLAQVSEEKNIPIKELIDQSNEYSAQRRKFLGNVAKASLAVGAVPILNACNKSVELVSAQTASDNSNARTVPKVVIVGAGIAGLNCAYQLKKLGYPSTVYEAATRTGGRMFSKTGLMGTGLTTELGGEYIDSSHKDMLNLASEFGLSLIDTLGPTETGLYRDSFFVNGQLYTEADIITAFQPYASRISADIKSLPPYIGYDKFNNAAAYFDGISIAGYFDSIGMSGWIRTGLETAYLTEYGRETNDQSSINFLYLFNADTSNGFEIFGVSDERYKILGGNQQITDAIYNKLKTQVNLGMKLVRIKQEVSGYSVYFQNANGITVTVAADILVITIPFSLLRSVQMDVALPTVKTSSIQNVGYGTNSKLILGFNSRIWRNYNNSGYMYTDRGLQTGWDSSALQPTTAASYTVYQGGNLGVALGNGTPASQVSNFMPVLEAMWPGATAQYNNKVERMQWPSYQYTLGSYTCYRVGQWTTIGGAEKENVGNMFFAGEHCSFLYQGFMNGGAETGRVAANKVAGIIKTW